MIHKTISPLGLQRLQAFEGFVASPVELADGRWIYGYGHVAIAKPEAPASREQAAALLKMDAAPSERAVNALVHVELTQPQFDALVSFAFSVGVEAFAKSEVLRRVNLGRFVEAACAMDSWRKSAVSGESLVMEALVRRRAQEKAMLLDAASGAPSAWLKPELDHAAAILGAPVEAPALPRFVSDETPHTLDAAPAKKGAMAAFVDRVRASIVRAKPARAAA